MFDLIVNPKGGKGKSLKTLVAVEAALSAASADYEVHLTQRAGHATEIMQSLTQDKTPRKVLVIGGDGTLHEILNGIVDFENLTLGVIPAGTGNDFARASGCPTDVNAAVALALRGDFGFVDFIEIGKQRSLNVAGAGMDVDVLLKYAELKGHGRAKYYQALLSTLLNSRSHRFKISLDGAEPILRSTFMIGLGNGRFIGGGMPICPNALVDDGLIDVVIVNDVPKRKIPLLLLKFLQGKITEQAFCEEYRVKSCTIDILDDSRFEFDGEVQSSDIKNLAFTVISGKLKMFR